MDIDSSAGDDTIKKLLPTFYSGSLLFDLQPEDIQNFTWHKQKTFLNLSVYRESIQKYPINPNFCRLFFKKIISILEPLQEIHDDMYMILCSTMNTQSGSEFYYQHYLINDNLEDEIIIQETKKMVVNGTTGLKTWEAAFILADWALCNKSIFTNKKILELGSGVGFTGIAISKHCDIFSMTMSDCHPDVINTLQKNVDINFSDKSEPHSNNNKNIEVINLDWNSLEDLQMKYNPPDTIIGSDIVYDPSILQPLCNVLQFFCQRNPNLEIYICSIIRNEKTFNAFQKTLASCGFSFNFIKHTESITLGWDKSIEKCLMKISKIY